MELDFNITCYELASSISVYYRSAVYSFKLIEDDACVSTGYLQIVLIVQQTYYKFAITQTVGASFFPHC